MLDKPYHRVLQFSDKCDISPGGGVDSYERHTITGACDCKEGCMRNIKVLFLTMLIVALLLSGANVYAYSVQPPGMTVLTPASGGFYLPGESVSFCVFVPGSGVYGNQIPVLTIYYPFRVSYSQSRVAIASLNTAITSPLGGYECSGSSEMPSTIWVPGSYNSGTHTWDMPEIQSEPSGVTSLSSEYLPGYIAMSDLSFYTSGTTTFFYTNPTSNSFWALAPCLPLFPR